MWEKKIIDVLMYMTGFKGVWKMEENAVLRMVFDLDHDNDSA